MSEKTEADEIEKLLDRFQVMSERAIRNVAWEASCDAAKQTILNRIRSIISERDQLRKAANEDLICEQMIEDEIAKMNRNAARFARQDPLNHLRA